MLILLGDVSVEDALEKLETTSSAPISSAVVNNTVLAMLPLPTCVTMRNIQYSDEKRREYSVV